MADENRNYWKTSLLNDSDVDLTFQVPDIRQLKRDRKKRDLNLFKNIDAKSPSNFNLTPNDRERAAIMIQKLFRGYMGRKEYIDRLYNDVLLEEEKLHEQQEMQVQEGELLIENYKIERDLDDDDQICKNKSRLLNSNAVLIQRAWRDHNKSNNKDHICCTCNDDYPDLFEYYNQTKTICFCCEEHRLNPEKDQFSENTGTSVNLLPYPTSDWLNIDMTHLNEEDSVRNRNQLELRNFESKLTFVESYESDIYKPQVEIYNPTDTDAFVDINIEQVTDSAKNRSPDALEPFIESTRVLKSLEIHEEHDEKKREESVTSTEVDMEALTKSCTSELKEIIEKLNSEIALKNVELVAELMIRDELHSNHESLLMDADDLAKKC